jgi:toxin ParE1/3/4
MAEIVWTDEAQHWLTDIFEYIAADNPQAAARTVQGIYDRAQDLKRFPEIGSRYTISLNAPRARIALRALPNRIPHQR